MRLLITGADGQLGRTMRELLSRRDDVTAEFSDVAQLDITDAGAVHDYVGRFSPDYIINCAAYTAVDRAEGDEARARLLNADAVRNLAEAARDFDARLVHVSTDYVFSGEGCRPWRETDEPSPRSAYGRTKLLGENAALELLTDRCVILRTAWLYSPYGNNFVKTMLRLAGEQEELRVVADQFGTPTSALTLGRAIMTVLDAPDWHPGIYHITDSGAASWYDLAVAALTEAGIENCRVKPITTEEYPAQVERPRFSVLSKEKFMHTYGIIPPHWQQSLRECVETIKAN